MSLNDPNPRRTFVVIALILSAECVHTHVVHACMCGVWVWVGVCVCGWVGECVGDEALARYYAVCKHVCNQALDIPNSPICPAMLFTVSSSSVMEFERSMRM